MWVQLATSEVSDAIGVLAQNGSLAASDAILAADLVRDCPALLQRMRHLVKEDEASLLIRIHGDLHLGQVLVAGTDVQIIDFEGEPRKSLAQRRAKASPMRDVAGMLRSFHYVVGHIARTRPASAAATEARTLELLEMFVKLSKGAFLAGYADGANCADLIIDADLLTLFTIEKAAYEVRYEAANRPDWLTVPLNGLADLARRMLGDAN